MAGIGPLRLGHIPFANLFYLKSRESGQAENFGGADGGNNRGGRVQRRAGSQQTLPWSERDSNARSRCDGQRYGVRSFKRRFDRRGMTSGAARNGLRFQLVLLPFHASDGPFWSGGLQRAVP